MEVWKDTDQAIEMHQLLNSKCTDHCPGVVVPGKAEGGTPQGIGV